MAPLYKPFEYDLHVPYALLFFQIALAYLSIAPLIVPFAVMFFYGMQVRVERCDAAAGIRTVANKSV
eukprot:4359098-Pyramimonas_sp.AAC.1